MRIEVTDINNEVHIIDIINENDIKFETDSGKFINKDIIGDSINEIKKFIEENIDYFELEDFIDIDSIDHYDDIIDSISWK